MASISKGKNGHRVVQFVGADGRRRSIRLGKVSQRIAESIKTRIELLNAAVISGQAPDTDTARWVASLDTVMQDKLARVGLAPKSETATLRTFIDRYITSRVDVKPNTTRAWRQSLTHLCEFFGADTSLRSISKGDAKDFRLKLIAKGLAEASVRKYCGFAKHFLAEAADRQLIERNPFADVVSSPIGNAKRQYFVTQAEIQKVLDTCPDAEWRLIVALSRYGGLRCPSEHLTLRWEDILWDQQRFIVHSPKTERHIGHESRVVPLFPELLPYLEEAFALAEPGAEYVLNRYRDATDSAVRTQLTRIIKRAGLKPWPRVFHNLRASRQTELESEHPTHVVCAWIGNSPLVARKHYLQVTDDHFEKATEAACSALQNPVQSSAETGRNEPQPDDAAHEKSPCLQGAASVCDDTRKHSTGVDGNRTHQTPWKAFHRF